MKAFWLAFPLLVVIGLDGLFTLRGQPPAYRQGDHARTDEASQVGRAVLERGPRTFVLATAGWALGALLLCRVLPGLLGQACYGAVGLGHAWGSASWVPLESVRALRALGRQLGGDGGEACLSLARSPHLGHWSVLVYLFLLALLTAFCWRRAGLLPSAAAKPKAPADKKRKD